MYKSDMGNKKGIRNYNVRAKKLPAKPKDGHLSKSKLRKKS